MIQKAVLRAVLQLACLSAAALFISTTPVHAEYDCPAYAAQCSQQGGESITYTYQYSVCVEYADPPNQWQCVQWAGVYEWEYGSGVENFECDEVAEYHLCQCRY